MKTLVVKFEYLDRDDLYDAVLGLLDSLNMDPDDWDWESLSDDENGEEIVRYRRTCMRLDEEVAANETI